MYCLGFGWASGGIFFAGYADDGFETALDVGFCGGPGRDADAHRGVSLPDCSSAPAGAVFLNASDDLARGLRGAEGYENLIDDNVVQHVETGMT